MIQKLGDRLSVLFQKAMPDPFVLALLLTGLVMCCALFFGESYPAELGLWERGELTLVTWKSYLFEPRSSSGALNMGYLYFGFQMCVMLVTGHALATSQPVARGVRLLSRIPRSAGQAVALVSFVACVAALIHWALGLIVGALVARQTGQQCAARGLQVHYPLLGAAGYTGLMVWGGGLSGSIPLKAATYTPPEHLAASFPFEGGIPLTETIYSPLNFMVCGALLLFVPFVAAMLHPSRNEDISPCAVENQEVEAVAPEAGRSKIVTWLEEGRGPAWTLAFMGLGALGIEFWRKGFALNDLTFNQLNVLFLFGGLLLQGSLMRYVRAVGNGVSWCAGILLQFPFYFGIIGLLLVSGLGSQISAGIASVTTEATYSIATFFSAGFVNLLVPSGGGQWLVQKDIVLEGALAYKGIVGESVLAMAYGDGWSNMLQPFWAIPLLAITGLKAREIVGYTATIMLFSGLLITTLLFIG